MFTLSQWYTREEITRRIAIFFFGMFGGTAVGPLLGAGLLKLDGRGSLSGWQWIFLGEMSIHFMDSSFHISDFEFLTVEGLWTITVSLMLLVFLPERRSYEQPSEPEKAIEETDSTSRKVSGSKIPLKVILETLSNVSKWPHFLATACVFATWSPLTTYTPSIIMSLGFSRVESNALTAIGNIMTLPVVFFFAWLSDKTCRRGMTVMIAITVYMIALICLRVIQPHVDAWGKFGLWTIVNALAVGYHPIHNAWIQMNSRSPEERSIGVA